jgi:hypothetical protein
MGSGYFLERGRGRERTHKQEDYLSVIPKTELTGRTPGLPRPMPTIPELEWTPRIFVYLASFFLAVTPE